MYFGFDEDHPGGGQVEGRGGHVGSLHVPYQLCQAKLPLCTKKALYIKIRYQTLNKIALRGGKSNFLDFFFKGASATKCLEKSTIFREAAKKRSFI